MSKTEEPKDSSPADASGKTGTADEIKKALETLKKQVEGLVEQLPEKKPAGKPSEEGDLYLVNLVGYHALNRAGRTIAEAIAQEKQCCTDRAEGTVLIVERSDLATWEQSYLNVYARLSRLKELVEMGVQVSGGRAKPSRIAFGPALVGALTMAPTIIESVTAIGVALGKCIAFFTPETTVRGVPIALGTGELAVAVASRLRTGARSVRLLRHQTLPAESDLRNLLESVYRLSVQFGQSINEGEGAALDPGEGPSGVEGSAGGPVSSTELSSGGVAWSKKLLAEVEAGLKDLTVQESLLRDAFSWELLLAQDYTCLLCLEVVSSGGTVGTDTSPLGTKMAYLGGCTVTYALLTQDRTICLSDLVPVVYSFTCNPSAPGEGSLSYVAMAGEKPFDPFWAGGT